MQQPVVSEVMKANSFNAEDWLAVAVKSKQLLQWLNGNMHYSYSGIVVKVFWEARKEVSPATATFSMRII